MAKEVWVVACCWFCICAWPAENPLHFSSKEDRFFKEDRYTGSSYIHFLTNNTYIRIDREHMFVEENDRGTWTQDLGGLITMKSVMHYRNIEASGLSLGTWHTNLLHDLPQIHEVIMSLLRTNDSVQFGANFVGEQLVRLPGHGTNSFSPISVNPETTVVSRAQLQSLSQAIEVFTNRTENNHFHVVPMKYKEFTFLSWKDEGNPDYRNLSEIKDSIDRLRTKSGKKEVLSLVYTSIEEKTFDDEAGRIQEFIFHPAMQRSRTAQTNEQK